MKFLSLFSLDKIVTILAMFGSAVLFGGGSWIIKGCKNDKEVKALNKTIASQEKTIAEKNQALSKDTATIKQLNKTIVEWKSTDSLNKALERQRQLLISDLTKQIKVAKADNLLCNTMRLEDLQRGRVICDTMVVEPVNKFLSKKIKYYKVLPKPENLKDLLVY